MASQDERVMISERVAPGMLPRVLNSFDMTIIFVAIVLFIVNASAIQQAHQAAYTYWILGFLAFLIPGALVTAQLGQMFPQEGSLYVWTQKALGPFWGFFAGFCAWWPWFGFVIFALLGIEVPLNMGVEIVHMRSIKKYLLWGSIFVMFAYLWATLGTMLALPAAKSVGATTDILGAVQRGFWGSHTFAIIIGLVLIWFFVANTIVYNYSFSRLLFVSGLEQRMPAQLGRVNEKTKVPVYVILMQTVLPSLIVIAIFNP